MIRKSIISLALLLGLGTASMMADGYSATATDKIYDFTGFSDVTLLNLFYDALQQGRRFPTMAEFEAAGIQRSDIEFVRSHVRKAAIMDRSDRIITDTYQDRNLWMNIPMGVGSGGDAGYPRAEFSSDVFSMWNYTNLFGSWNHSIFQAPGSWVDAAHRNGTDIMSGIKFFESWGTGDGAYTEFITTKNADGTYKYAKPLINCLMFFGSDGINYNWEDNSYSKADCTEFHRALYAYAKEVGFNEFHAGIYTQTSGLTSASARYLYGDSNGQTFDLMLNYASSDFSYQMKTSAQAAVKATGSADRLYAGVWIVSMNRRWSALAADADTKKCGICLWGEHGQSRFMSYNAGEDAYGFQSNYQRLLERAFSGGNRNPLTRPAVSNTGNDWEGENALRKFAGLATWIPERSAIQGHLPFTTCFSLGNGDRYFYKGKRTTGSWYNMSAQDLVPTYRWLVVDPGTMNAADNIAPEFTHKDAYIGGSSLKLSGTAKASGTDVILYKTSLVASTGAKARVALKHVSGTEHNASLSLILKVNGNWQEYPLNNTRGNTWEDQWIQLPSLTSGSEITRIGLRIKGNGACNILVGQLEILDDTHAVPANVVNPVVEVKEETKTTLSAKIYWDVDATAVTRAANGLVYNDEANIHHFEILYKNGEDGDIVEVGRTSQWATYIGNIQFESPSDEPWIGVRSVSTDLECYSPVQWVKIDRAPQASLPDFYVDTYGVTGMDPNSEGADIARQQRYVTLLKTQGADQDLNYTCSAPVADGSQYADCRDMTLKVHQGQKFTMTIKAFDTTNAEKTDGLRYCFGGAWLDLNGSGTFDHPKAYKQFPGFESEATDVEGELIYKWGKLRNNTPEIETTGLTFTVEVPADATPGKSRLRIVFDDAWFQGMFLPTGLTAKGFSMDFNAEITGSNPGRTVVETRDQGKASEPERISDANPSEHVDAIQAVSRSNYSQVVAHDGELQFQNCDKAWVYTLDGKLIQYIPSKPQALTVRPNTTYIVKMQSGQVIRTQKVR